MLVKLTKYTVAPVVMLSEDLTSPITRSTAVPAGGDEEWNSVILLVKFTFPVNVMYYTRKCLNN